MSRKRKRKRQPVGSESLFTRAQKELAKGNAKTALKDAVLCYREDASPAHRQLLEETYVGRIEQLHRKKQSTEARSVLARLIEFDPTTAEVLEKIPNLQIVLGDSSVDANGVFKNNPALLVQQTDRAVLDSREVVPDFANSKLFVEKVRDALVAIERGDDESAITRLSDIPRSSPLCDWKVFVRGLIAFYALDTERMWNNWRRLDAARPAYRIAQTLLVASGEVPREEAPIDVASPLHRLERHLRDDPATELLEELADHWREDDQESFFRAYRRLAMRFAKTHRPLLEKIVDFVWKRSVRDFDNDAIDRLVQIGPAPVLDPKWNRARALLVEHPRYPDSFPVEQYWTAYADDLEGLATLREEERTIAVGMVYTRLGRVFCAFGKGCTQSSPFAEPDVESAHQFYNDAIRFFEQSIQRCPRLSEAYEGLAQLHEAMNAPEKCATVFQRLVQQQPDNFIANSWLANYYIGQEEPGKSAPHVEAIKRLKPRDSQTISLGWNQGVTMVRALTKDRLFEAARQELGKMAQSLPPNTKPYAVDVLRAAVEFKAKCMDAGRQYLDAALSAVDEPTAIWLRMSLSAARFGLPRKLRKDFDDHFKNEIKKKPTSQTAGRLGELLAPYTLNDIRYTGRATHERLVIDYLNRAKRVRWSEEDLGKVCIFLSLYPKQLKQQERLIEKGLKKFPNSAHLNFYAGQSEMEKGPGECDLDKAEHHLSRALELAPQSTESFDQRFVEMAERSLGVLQDFKERLALPFSSPFSSPYLDEEYDNEYDNECDCEYCRAARAAVADPDASDADDFDAEDFDAEAFLDELKQTIPRPIFKQLQRAAKRAGVSLVDMLGEITNKPK